jgi:hypothetical protein
VFSVRQELYIYRYIFMYNLDELSSKFVIFPLDIALIESNSSFQVAIYPV